MIVRFNGICPKTNSTVTIEIEYLNASTFDKPNYYIKHSIKSCPIKRFGCGVNECPISRAAPYEVRNK